MDNEKSAVERLKDKIEACYKAKYAEWMQKPPDCLIARAGEILSAQQILEALPDVASEEDAEYLLRFKDPLEVVSDNLVEMSGLQSDFEDSLSHTLWELRDKEAAEEEYELEPEFASVDELPQPTTPPQTQQMSV